MKAWNMGCMGSFQAATVIVIAPQHPTAPITYLFSKYAPLCWRQWFRPFCCSPRVPPLTVVTHYSSMLLIPFFFFCQAFVFHPQHSRVCVHIGVYLCTFVRLCASLHIFVLQFSWFAPFFGSLLICRWSLLRICRWHRWVQGTDGRNVNTLGLCGGHWLAGAAWSTAVW